MSHSTPPQMAYGQAMRHRYFFQDPVRLLCILTAGLLVWMESMPFELTLLAVAGAQMGALAMVLRFSERGWSYQWGSSHHPAALMSRMCIDMTNLSACTLVGALLLVRLFNGADVVPALGALIVAVSLIPDIRFCRWLLDADPARQGQHLKSGYFWRDPVKLGALFALGVVSLIRRDTLFYILMSMLFLQANTFLMFVDKYLSEIEVRRRRGWSALLLEREGQRLLAALLPFILVVARWFTDDQTGWTIDGTVAGFIAIPDLVRAFFSGLSMLWERLTTRREKPVGPPDRPIIWLVKP